MSKGKLYLIPAPLGENDPAEVIPAPVLALLPTLDCFVVEEVRTARRYLSRAGLKGHIEGLEFHELNEHTAPAEIAPLARLFDNGRNVGLISEAGLPAVADPGAALVALCHREGIEVVPLVGPSSLMLALMASGLNGQSFAFVGYIPAKTEDRRAAIRRLEKRSAAERQTQSGINRIAAELADRSNGIAVFIFDGHDTVEACDLECRFHSEECVSSPLLGISARLEHIYVIGFAL